MKVAAASGSVSVAQGPAASEHCGSDQHGCNCDHQAEVTDHVELAASLFIKGYNCAQATAAAFAEDYGLDPAFVLKAMAGFGAGLGGQRETCGAVSAMAFVASVHFGAYDPDDLGAKKALYKLVKGMVQEFRAQHGTVSCAELLRNASCAPQPEPSVRSTEYHAVRPCVRFVRSAAATVERALKPASR